MTLGRRRLAGLLVAAAVLLASCGGAPSNAGTSASNCVKSLERALVSAPSDLHFRGLAKMSGNDLDHFGMHLVKRGAYCVVIFRVEKPGRKGFFRLEAYKESDARRVAVRDVAGKHRPDLD